jgi:cytochrome c5
MKKMTLLLAMMGAMSAGSSFAAADRTGEAVFKAVCTTCHTAGLMNAPKITDKAAWKPRIAQGMPMLYDHALKGIRMMPAKGTCAACTDKEIKNGVDYMVSKSK